MRGPGHKGALGYDGAWEVRGPSTLKSPQEGGCDCCEEEAGGKAGGPK